VPSASSYRTVVEGDIFHRSLSIDENSLLEGSSRRVENPTDSSSIDPDLQRVDRWLAQSYSQMTS
jgi:cytoskeletal protein CcmA (bactofilin family)